MEPQKREWRSARREWFTALWAVGLCTLALVTSGWVLGLFVLVALLALLA